jgi:hypothetical protein
MNATATATRRFALIKREKAVPGVRPACFVIQIKDADDFRRWPYREDYLTYTSRDAAVIKAEMRGFIVVKRWADAELTHAEQEASGYFSH